MSHIVRAMIIEDMPEYIGTIEMLLKEVSPDVRVVATASSLSEAEQLLKTILPDVVLMDIQFENEGKTGFDLLDKLKAEDNIFFQLIIITAHFEKQHYRKAFEHNALHYLEKPVNKEKLASAIERVKSLQISHKINVISHLVEHEMDRINQKSRVSKICIKSDRYNEIIDLNDIVWIEADGRKSVIHMRNNRNIVSLDNIGTLDSNMQGYPEFMRINRSEIINLSYVERYSKKERLVILPGNSPNHYVSRDVFSEFTERISHSKFQ